MHEPPVYGAVRRMRVPVRCLQTLLQAPVTSGKQGCWAACGRERGEMRDTRGARGE